MIFNKTEYHLIGNCEHFIGHFLGRHYEVVRNEVGTKYYVNGALCECKIGHTKLEQQIKTQSK